MFTTVASRITINWVTRMTARTTPGRRVVVPDIVLLTPEGATVVRGSGVGLRFTIRRRPPLCKRYSGITFGEEAVMTSIPLSVTRPTRADAARNYDLLVTAARETFAEHGTDTSLEEIARRAGVGIGTLYRRFPNRTALLEAVYVDEIQSVCDRAYDFDRELPPFEALAAWLRSFVGYGLSKKTLAVELMEALGKDSAFFKTCKANVVEAGQLLLDKAKATGEVRAELKLEDVMRLVGGINMARDTEPEQAMRLLDIVLCGLRPAASGPRPATD